MRTLKERLKEYPGALKIIVSVLMCILMGVLILFVKTQYFKATKEQTDAYDRAKMLEDYAEPEEVIAVQTLDPEIDGAFNIMDRYLLFDHFSPEAVEWLQEEIEELCSFYVGLEDETLDTDAFYDTHEKDIYRYLGEISEGEFAAAVMKLRSRQMTFVLKDSFEHYQSAGLVTFTIESEDETIRIGCTVSLERKSFAVELLKY